MDSDGDGEVDHDLLDSLFRCLQSRPRRPILYHLLDTPPPESLQVPDDVYAGHKNIDALHIQLVHCHLPMLEEPGFIQWDREGNQIHRGEKFDDVAELMGVLREQETMLSE